MKKPTIHLYSICWNEEDMLGFFFDHYDPIVDAYFIYDDGSDDRSLEILNDHPKVEVLEFEKTTEDSYVLSAQTLHDAFWKKSRGTADWVIISAIDEFLFHQDFLNYISECHRNGITAIPALGYQMLSWSFPEKGIPIMETVRCGAPTSFMNKLSLFDPDAILETNFAVGRHTAEPVGEIKYPDRDELLNFHYKYLSMDYVMSRHQALNEKLGNLDKVRNFGHQYRWSMEELEKTWKLLESQALDDVILSSKEAHEKHSELASRWWRNE